MIDSLCPFQVPRRSGIAPCCAAAGAAVRVASTTIQTSFDIIELLEGLSRYLGACIYVRAKPGPGPERRASVAETSSWHSLGSADDRLYPSATVSGEAKIMVKWMSAF